MPRPPAEQVRAAADLLHSAAIHLLRGVGEADAESGISAARLSALSVIVFRGPLTLGELARAEGVRSPTMSGIVDGLQEAGLATRRRDPDDRRAVLVEATPEGELLLQAGRARRIERLARSLEELEPEELEAVARGAAAIERLFGIPSRPWRPLRRT
jgi:DNA-binding MarR family transcriptional regulator